MTRSTRSLTLAALAFILAAGLFACAPSGQRMGMVKDPDTGILYGSSIARNIVIDSSQFENRKLKVVIRNTSGDQNFDLHDFKERLEQAYAVKGYEPTQGDDFGLRLDVNVTYSGQIRQDMAAEGALIGGAAGGLGGYGYGNQTGHTVAGTVAGATVGAILGSYATDNTYIVIADTRLGVMRHKSAHKSTTIVFEGSQFKERKTNVQNFDAVADNRIAAYAGGRLVSQGEVVKGVRGRFLRILSDVI